MSVATVRFKACPNVGTRSRIQDDQGPPMEFEVTELVWNGEDWLIVGRLSYEDTKMAKRSAYSIEDYNERWLSNEVDS